jgi:hypothetical protein
VQYQLRAAPGAAQCQCPFPVTAWNTLKMNILKWVLIGMFVAGSLPMLSLATQHVAALLLTASWAGFLYWFWRI